MANTMPLSFHVGHARGDLRVFDTPVIHVRSNSECVAACSLLIAICFSLGYATSSHPADHTGSFNRSKLHRTIFRNAILDDSSSRLETSPLFAALHSCRGFAVVIRHFGISAPQDRNLSCELLITSSWRDRAPPRA